MLKGSVVNQFSLFCSTVDAAECHRRKCTQGIVRIGTRQDDVQSGWSDQHGMAASDCQRGDFVVAYARCEHVDP